MRSIVLSLLVGCIGASTVAGQDRTPVVGPPSAMVGEWRTCLTLVETRAPGVPVPNAVCGDIRVSSDTFGDIGAGARIVGLKARHTLNLGVLFRSSRWPAVGAVTFVRRDSITADSSRFRLQLGVIGGADNGGVVAWVRRDDSGALEGTWEISCYVCEGATGSIVLRRKQ